MCSSSLLQVLGSNSVVPYCVLFQLALLQHSGRRHHQDNPHFRYHTRVPLYTKHTPQSLSLCHPTFVFTYGRSYIMLYVCLKDRSVSTSVSKCVSLCMRPQTCPSRSTSTFSHCCFWWAGSCGHSSSTVSIALSFT